MKFPQILAAFSKFPPYQRQVSNVWILLKVIAATEINCLQLLQQKSLKALAAAGHLSPTKLINLHAALKKMASLVFRSRFSQEEA